MDLERLRLNIFRSSEALGTDATYRIVDEWYAIQKEWKANLINPIGNPPPSSTASAIIKGTLAEIAEEHHRNSDIVLASFSGLRDQLQRHGKLIMAHWSNMDLEARERLLHEVWPGIPTKNSILIYTKDELSEDTRTSAALWPDINVETICHPQRLQEILITRSVAPPKHFVRSDLDASRLGFWKGVVKKSDTENFPGPCCSFTNPDIKDRDKFWYGKFLKAIPGHFDRDSAHIIEAKSGCIVLRIQARLYAFLETFCTEILELAKGSGEYSESNTGSLISADLPSLDMAQLMTSNLSIIAPYHGPRAYSDSTALKILNLYLSTVEDNYILAKESPSWLQQQVHDHRNAHLNLPGDEASTADDCLLHCSWKACLHQVENLELWAEISKRMTIFLEEIPKYNQIDTLGIPKMQEGQLLSQLLFDATRSALARLKEALAASRNVSKYIVFERHEIIHLESEILIKHVKPDYPPRHTFELELLQLLYDPEMSKKIGFERLVFEFTNLQARDTRKGLISFNGCAERALTELVILAYLRTFLNRLAPWGILIPISCYHDDVIEHITGDSYSRLLESWKRQCFWYKNPVIYANKSAPLWKGGRNDTGKFLTLVKQLMDLAYPEDQKPNAARVREMIFAEQTLDSLWERLSTILKARGCEEFAIPPHINQMEVYRTPAWVKPAKIPRIAPVRPIDNAEELSLATLSFSSSLPAQKIDYEPQAKKEKQKTRGQPSILVVTQAAPEYQPVETTKIKLRGQQHKDSLEVLFGKSSGNSQMAWTEFCSTMQSLGFAVRPITGSEFCFTNEQGQSMSIHRPHPDPKLQPGQIYALRRRFRYRLGWSMDDFEFC